MNVTEKFLGSIDKLQKISMPSQVMARAKRSFLDYIAVTAAGAKFQTKKLRDYLSFSKPVEGDYLTVGLNLKMSLEEAVFLNGLNSHALDYDDGTNSGIIHLGSPIFSLCIPLAQLYDVSLDVLLRSAVIGYETSYTMAASIQPHHKEMGYHATGTCGVLGATVAASYMLGFTKEEKQNAFGTACVSATGMLKVLDDGSELKPYNVAKTSLLALQSLKLAKANFRSPDNGLGGSRGYLKMMTGSENVELMPLLLDGTYAIEKSYTKPYASCRYTHPSVEAAIYLNSTSGVAPEDVKRIVIHTYSLAIPGHNHCDCDNPYSAKMSIPFSVAAGFIYGRAGLKEFSDASIHDELILELSKKVIVLPDEGMSKNFPQMQSARVELLTCKGSSFHKRVDYPKGEPQNPLSDGEFYDRYETLMNYGGWSGKVSQKIFNMVYSESISVNEILGCFGLGD